MIIAKGFLALECAHSPRQLQSSADIPEDEMLFSLPAAGISENKMLFS
jgi:hypothetical protein